MFIALLASGLTGAFFYYALLLGIQRGSLKKGPLLWSRCVGACALMLAASASGVVWYVIDEDATYSVILALWPVFILALEPGYRLTRYDGREEESGEKKE